LPHFFLLHTHNLSLHHPNRTFEKEKGSVCPDRHTILSAVQQSLAFEICLLPMSPLSSV
jgi:hypothetical protein